MRMGRQGSSITEALVSAGILSLAAASFAQGLENFNVQQARSDRSVALQELLVDSASTLLRQDFFSISEDCSRVASLASRCLNVAGDDLTGNLAPDPLSLPGTERRLTRMGEVSQSGDYCVEVLSCRDLGSNRLKEVKLRGYFRIQAGQVSVVQRDLAFRKGRW